MWRCVWIEIWVRVAHGYRDGRMSQQLLHCHEVCPLFQQAGIEGVP
jgi:hypothetical protein